MCRFRNSFSGGLKGNSMIAQTTDAAEVLVTLVVLGLVGLIPAFIANSKGRNFFAWWLFGALFFIIALIVALVIQPLNQQSPRTGGFTPSWENPTPRPASTVHALGATKLAYKGSRFVLGKGVDYYGIWDCSVNARAQEVFPLSNEGWQQAWNRFSVLEAHPTVVEQVPSHSASVPKDSRRMTSATEGEPPSHRGLMSPPEASTPGDEKVCPDCAETVKGSARVCRFCGYRFHSGADEQGTAASGQSESESV
jgi:hypothetical protein